MHVEDLIVEALASNPQSSHLVEAANLNLFRIAIEFSEISVIATLSGFFSRHRSRGQISLKSVYSFLIVRNSCVFSMGLN